MNQPRDERQVCARCGEYVGTGSALYSDRVRDAEGRILCAECAGAEQGHPSPVHPIPEVPVTQPNPNLPLSH